MMISSQRPARAACGPAAIVGLLLLATGLLAGCSARKQEAPRQAVVPVSVATAVRSDVPLSLRAIGTVESYNTVSVQARIGGELVRVSFQEGQNVRKGELLFTIDPRPSEAALQSALADSARDAAQAANAEADAQRYAELVKKEYVTQQQADQAMATAAAAKATVAAGAAAVRTASLNLSYCYIRAPISGRTGNLRVHEGNLVSANGSPLVTIQQLQPIYVSFSVPSEELPEVRSHAASGNLQTQATLSSDTTRVYTGELTFIDNTVDPSTGTILLKASFPNQDEALWPGEFVTTKLIVSTLQGATVIPVAAVQNSQQGSFVYVLKPDMTAVNRAVRTGPRIDDAIVVESGVEPGDRVVTDGQLRLVPGAKVEIKPGVLPGGIAEEHPGGPPSQESGGGGAPAAGYGSSDTSGASDSSSTAVRTPGIR